MKIYFKAYIRLYGITLTDLITYSLHPSLLLVGPNSNGTPSRWWRPAVSPSARSHCCSRAAGEIIHWGFSYQRTWLLIIPWDNGHRCWLKGSCRLQRLSSARWWAWETLLPRCENARTWGRCVIVSTSGAGWRGLRAAETSSPWWTGGRLSSRLRSSQPGKWSISFSNLPPQSSLNCDL